MQLVTEMALPYVPVEGPAFAADPMPFLEAARRQHPWLAKFSEGYFVHGYKAIVDLGSMDDRLRTSFDEAVEFYGAQGTSWGRFMKEQIIALSGPTHVRIRRSVALAFTPRNANQFRPLMHERITDLLDQWAPKRRFDFAEFASNYPISVMCGLLGIATDALPRIRDALETLGKAFSMDRNLLPELLAGYETLWSYVDDIVTQREKEGPTGRETLLDSLIATKSAGEMDAKELRYLILILLLAGYDTSKNMLTLLVYTLLQRPGDWQRCAQDPAYCVKVVEEMLRYMSIVSIFRTVAQEFVYEDIRFPKGITLVLGNSLSGRDPAAFPDGEQFRPEHTHPNRHAAFGRGAHVCLGQHLARAQIAEGLHMITRRMRNPKVAGRVEWRAFLGTWGLESLPIEFEAA